MFGELLVQLGLYFFRAFLLIIKFAFHYRIELLVEDVRTEDLVDFVDDFRKMQNLPNRQSVLYVYHQKYIENVP